MNWIRDYVKPTLRSVLRRAKDDSDDVKWHSCDNCGQMIYHKEFEADQQVCAHCGHHHRIGPAERFGTLFDKGEFELIVTPKGEDDPLKFKDQKRYADRLKENRKRVGQNESITSAAGKLGGKAVVVAVQNFQFMGGSLSVGAGDAFLAAARRAIADHAALIIFTATGGARMQEGTLSLMQMPRTTVAVEMVREAGLPYIVVLTDPTTGGVTASYGMLGDIHIAEPGALIGLSGPRVIEGTIREKLPEGFQRAEYLLDHGMVDMVVQRKEMREILMRVISLLMDKVQHAEELPLLEVVAAGMGDSAIATDAKEGAKEIVFDN